MGVYIFNTDVLVKKVIGDAKASESDHDFGKNVVPRMIDGNRVFVHSFTEANNASSRYWRDIGTLDRVLGGEHGFVFGRPAVQPLR